MSLVTEQHEFLQDVAALLQFVEKKGYKVTGGELFRTTEQQELYVKTGRSKTMNSNHLKRLAIDLNFFTPEGKLTYELSDVRQFGEYWEQLNVKNKAGMFWHSFKDVPHFERIAY